MEISIIIPTKDRAEVFEKTLTSAIAAIKGTGHEIIIINDSKTSEIKLPLGAELIKVLKNTGSGVASARNLGVENAKHGLILFLDDDILISAENLTVAIDFITRHEKSALNLNWVYPIQLTASIYHTKFGRYLIQRGFTSLKGWRNGSLWNDDKIFICDLISSYFLMIRKKDFEATGGYDERFPYAGAEDFEFAKRVISCGIIPYIDPVSTVFHNERDRVQLLPWLLRKQRSALTRKVAFEMGYKEIAIEASKMKIQLRLHLYHYRSLLFLFLFLVPNLRIFDKISFKLIDFLVALNLYKGYFGNRKE